MHPIKHTLALSALLLLPITPLLSAEGTAPAAPSTVSRPREAKLFTGEITEIAGDRFTVRPWNPDLPRRVQVTAAPGARYFEQREGRLSDLKMGEFVLVVEEEPPVPKEPITYWTSKGKISKAEERRIAAELKEGLAPRRANAVLRFGPAEGEKVRPEDAQTARNLLAGALAYFKGHKRGGLDKPTKDARRVVGVVTSLSPLRVRAEERVFECPTWRETVLVNVTPAGPEVIKRGETVLLQPEADGEIGTELRAALIARCPRPMLGPGRAEKFQRREERRKP